jgi:hypothetical protein
MAFLAMLLNDGKHVLVEGHLIWSSGGHHGKAQWHQQ